MKRTTMVHIKVTIKIVRSDRDTMENIYDQFDLYVDQTFEDGYLTKLYRNGD